MERQRRISTLTVAVCLLMATSAVCMAIPSTGSLKAKTRAEWTVYSSVVEARSEWRPTTGNAARYCNRPIMSQYDGMRFVISNPTSSGADITFANNNALDIYFEYGFDLYCLSNSAVWCPVPFANIGYWPLKICGLEEVPYLNDGYMDFYFFFNNLQPGTYRFIKSVLTRNCTGDLVCLVYLFSDFVVCDSFSGLNSAMEYLVSAL